MSASTSIRALVIDDSRATRAIIKKILIANGFEVLEAGDGLDALDIISRIEGTPDVALVDWNMPRMNGLEFLGVARSREALSGMKILMVTTESEERQVRAALDAGADEYLMKPFTTEALQGKLALLGLATP
jgi:two-component system chemotaxis response regulator CheY